MFIQRLHHCSAKGHNSNVTLVIHDVTTCSDGQDEAFK